jgi:hypothetical protein
MQEYAMTTLATRARREAKDRIAQQLALVKDLQQSGLKTLASVTRKILSAMQKSEKLMEPARYRPTKKRRANAH